MKKMKMNCDEDDDDNEILIKLASISVGKVILNVKASKSHWPNEYSEEILAQLNRAIVN